MTAHPGDPAAPHPHPATSDAAATPHHPATSDAVASDLPRPIAAGWLALREPADTRARDAAAPALLPPLLAALHQPPGDLAQPHRGLRVVDLGAGTGANLRWLAPRLPEPQRQHWLLVDHDPGLLARGPVQATAVRADVADLARVLAEHGGADLITAAALLDLLDVPQLTAIVDAVVAAGVPALFSLTVTGAVTLDPPDPLDAPLAEAFDAHQRRAARAGPDAAAVTARLFRDRGWTVIEAATPWKSTPLPDTDPPVDGPDAGRTDRRSRDGDLIDAWLDGRVEAALEQDPSLAPAATSWLARRRTAPNRPAVTVGHVDLLALPPSPA